MAVDKQRRFEKLRGDMRRLVSVPGITFTLFFAWKVGLLLFTSQPVPANDSFFYDGPVVNYVLHGKYCNPALAEALPISGTQIFSAYPPLYQFVLLGWMKYAGTSALAAMWLHVLLLGVFSLTVFATLRELSVAVAAINGAGLFLFAITFHDRPDTLAHVLGALAVLTLVRRWNTHSPVLPWFTAIFLVLTFCTSLQIGGIYLFLLMLLSFASPPARTGPLPWLAMLAFVAAVMTLVGLVRFGYPHLWAGFQEHVNLTPSVTGWRVPSLADVLKIARTSAGIFLVAGLLGWRWVNGKFRWQQLRESPPAIVVACGVVTALVLVAGCLVLLTPNTVHIANYLQPLIVGCFLTTLSSGCAGLKSTRPVIGLFAVALLVVSLRAVGLSTWGVLCARDVNRAEAITRVRTELDSIPQGGAVLLSSAYLYEGAQRTNVNWIHSDWPAPPGREIKGIIRLRVARLILTQFDYYRRYQYSIDELRVRPNPPQFRITDTARLRPPDAFPSLQKILQHVSWAPIIVEVTWPAPLDSIHENTTTGQP